MPLLTVTVVSTSNIKGGDVTSEADPYVKLKYAKQTFKTRVQQDAGASADFHETFTFELTGAPFEMDVQVLDKDFLIDQFLAKTTVDFEDVVKSQGRRMEEFQLKDRKGNDNGTVTLALKYTGL